MSAKFDHGRPKVYFSSRFIKNHIFEGSESEKKKAENVFLRRGRNVSTVITLNSPDLVRLAGEIHRRQSEFAANPKKNFTSHGQFDFWSRGGSMAKDKQRASSHHGRFQFAVWKNVDGIYVMDHFHALA